MRSILFYPDAAEALNEKAQKKIASHLFLIANYNPETVYAFSTDAKFYKAINNLYKFTIDASIINWLFKIRDKFGNQIAYNSADLKKHIEVISTLRSVSDHNFSEANGTDINNRYYKQWLVRIAGKEELTCPEDFEKPLAELENIGNEIVSIVNTFIDNASKAVDRSTIVLNWENCIFDFYNTSNGESIVKAQLFSAYKARVITRNIPRQQLERNVISWCKKMFIDDKEYFINTRQELISKIKDKNAITRLQELIGQKQKEIDEIKRSVAMAIHKGDENQIGNKSYYIFYTKRFGDRMKLFLATQSNYELTLLPQDIVDEIVESDFKNVQAQ